MSDDPSLYDAENWEVAKGSEGYGWVNVETHHNLGVIENEDDPEKGEWILTTDNHVIDWFDDREKARIAALNWMLENPRPVNL